MKNFITEKEALLPLEGIEVMGDELMFILGGTIASSSSGSGCGCGCGTGAGCGCGCSSGAGCGCGCGSGAGCGCISEGNSPADNSPTQ